MRPSTEELLLRLGARRSGIDPAGSEDLAELVRSGLVDVQDGKAGKPAVRLTDEGRRRKDALVRKNRPRRAASLDDLRVFEERIIDRISQLIDAKLTALELRLQTRHPTTEPHVVVTDALAARVLSAIQQIDQAQRLDGIVPLHQLRAQLMDVPGPQLDHALVELERQYRIDLKIANDPKSIFRPDSGIRLPGRGLAYYAAIR
jgi:hypothetical protein